MHKSLDFAIKGIAPLIMHNGQLADPMNDFARQMKEITSKRKKTETDLQLLADLEWEGSLYLDEKLHPCIPGEIIEAAMAKGARRFKLGEVCKEAVYSDGNWPLIYDGPKTIKELKADLRFRDRRTMPQNGNRIVRCRPVFMPWRAKITIDYLPDLLSEEQVVRILGCSIVGDHRPKYGRFVIE
jgi:hypothetical protein